MPLVTQENSDDLPELGVAPEKVRFVIVKARQFDAKEADSDPDEGSDAVDDKMSDVLEDKPSEDSVQQELISFINGLDEEEQINLVALAWLGRGTFDIADVEMGMGTGGMTQVDGRIGERRAHAQA